MYLLAAKQNDDISRRLKSLHSENEELRAQLSQERSQKESALKDVSLLKDETAALQVQ